MSSGRGPTRLMSPRRMFHRLGSSSRLVERRRRPKGVSRSASCSGEVSGGALRIERNLTSVKGAPSLPGRTWRKSTGRPRSRATRTATTACSGAVRTSATADTTTSIARLGDVVGAPAAAHRRAARNASTCSTTRSNCVVGQGGAAGQREPGAEEPLRGAVGVGRPAGEDRLEVHRLPERTGLDVGLGEVLAQVVGRPAGDRVVDDAPRSARSCRGPRRQGRRRRRRRRTR